MHTNAPKRKVKFLLFRLFRLFIFFLVVLFLAFGIYQFITLRQQHLISPLTNTPQASPTPSSDQTIDSIQGLLQKANIAITNTTTASDSSIIVKVKDGPEVVFSQQKKLSEQIASLQLITSRLTIEGKRPTRIDLRFDNPVVSF